MTSEAAVSARRVPGSSEAANAEDAEPQPAPSAMTSWRRPRWRPEVRLHIAGRH
jgi:hypothetical protein